MSVPWKSRGSLSACTLAVALLSAGCGPRPTETADSGPEDVITDGGVAIQCPTGYALSSTVQITYADAGSAVGCWQATLASSPTLQVYGLPDFELGPDQLSLQFNAMDSGGNACTYSNGASIPLSSSCVVVEGSNVSQWFTFSNIASGSVAPAGSLTINEWPTASGQPLSVTFSSDAALVVHAQSGTTIDGPVVGSFQVNAM